MSRRQTITRERNQTGEHIQKAICLDLFTNRMSTFLNLFSCVCSSANKCLLKVGLYCAQLEQYPKAIEIYEQVCLMQVSLVKISVIISKFIIVQKIMFLFFPGCNQHNGQPTAEVQCQGVLLQSCSVPLYCWWIKCKGRYSILATLTMKEFLMKKIAVLQLWRPAIILSS